MATHGPSAVGPFITQLNSIVGVGIVNVGTVIIISGISGISTVTVIGITVGKLISGVSHGGHDMYVALGGQTGGGGQTGIGGSTGGGGQTTVGVIMSGNDMSIIGSDSFGGAASTTHLLFDNNKRGSYGLPIGYWCVPSSCDDELPSPKSI